MEHIADNIRRIRLQMAEAAAAAGAKVFHAGTALNSDGQLVNAGGRVLGVTARGKDVAAAIKKAYEAVDCISWEKAFCRRDIGYHALEHEAKRSK